jgi:hypothetical protein
MSPRDRRQGNSSRPQVAAEGLIEARKEAFFESSALQTGLQNFR